MIEVKFDKRTKRALQVGEGECAFCRVRTKVAKANPDMHICAKCYADIELEGAVGVADRTGLSGQIVVHAKADDL